MKRNLSKLTQNPFDLVIVGGGIYGACTAWDAVLRGLTVAVVDRGDFGGETSANSQKIIHGGFRYLQHADFKRMRESIRERTTLMKIAPHLIHPLPILIPTSGHGLKSRELFRLALAIYDAVGFDRNRGMDPSKQIPRGYTLSKEDVMKILPQLPNDGLTGAAVFYDAEVYNSERLVLEFLRSAENLGAVCANYVKATAFLKEDNRILGVEAEDVFSGDKFEIRGKLVVNTSGPWVYRVLGRLEQYRDRQKFPLVKSINIVTRSLFGKFAVGLYGKNKFLDKDALINKGSRLFFVTPWRDFSVVGTALSYYDEDPDKMTVTRSDIEALLNDFNEACPSARLTLKDVSWIHSGFLPSSGVNPSAGNVQISKKYRILDHRTEGLYGLLSTIGVKYTTARDVAEKVINRAMAMLDKPDEESPSSEEFLFGGHIEHFQDFLTESVKMRPQGITEAFMKSLIFNYGSRFNDLLKLAKDEGEHASVLNDQTILRAQVLYAVREEMAQKLSDVILRRTELGSAGHPGEGVLEFCANVMAAEMQWSSERKRTELNEVQKIFTFFG